jgi:multiple sugar transport system substrate-binding protein
LLARRLTSLLLLALLLAGCAKPPERTVHSPDPPQATGGMTTIRLAMSAQDSFLIDLVLPAYNAKYPNDRVEVVGITDVDRDAAIRRKLQAGEVDVVWAGEPQFLAMDGLLLPLDPLIQRDRFDLKLLGIRIDDLRVDGKLYDLPWMVSAEALFYNKALFKGAGLSSPHSGWSWEEFRQTAARLTSGEGANRTWGFGLPSHTALVDLWLGTTGTPLEGARNEEAVRAVLQFLGTMATGDRAIAPPAEASALFQGGRSAMLLTSSPNIRGFTRSWTFDWSIAPMPVHPGMERGVMRVRTESLAVAANAPSSEGAWRLVRFLAGPEAAEIIASAGYIPLYKTPEVQRAWAELMPGKPEAVDAIFGPTWRVNRSMVRDGGPQRLYLAVNIAAQQIMTANRPWEEAFAEYQATVKKAGGAP